MEKDGESPSGSMTYPSLRERLKQRRMPTTANLPPEEERMNARGQFTEAAFLEELDLTRARLPFLPQSERDALARATAFSQSEKSKREQLSQREAAASEEATVV
jgi:hypothetical protein